MSVSRVEDIGEVALETEEISKHFGAVRAVDRLSLSIPRGGMTSIVGPNGSGKSTLVNLLSGTLPLDGGMVIIDGTGLRVVHAYETPEHGLTRTFQEVRLFDQISVLDNIIVVLTSRGYFRRCSSERSPNTGKERGRFWKTWTCGTSETRWRWSYLMVSGSCSR